MAEPPAVPFLDLGATHRELRTELDEAYRRVMASGWYLLGDELEGFEEEFARFLGVRECVGVACGLDALTLALRAVGIRAGDEVVVPSNTYIATWLAVSAVGAVPVPVEPDPDTGNLDPTLVEAVLGERTRAIVPVHLYGRAAPLDEVLELARRHDLRVVEDAAQAHGARYRGRRLGAAGDAVAWSFYPGKNLGAFADAGAVTTDDAEVAERLRLLRNYGSKVKYHHEVPGVNSRMDELQAAFLRVKLARLDDWNARRAAVADRYLDAFAELGPRIVLPPPGPDGTMVWHLFVVRSPRRDELQAALAARGVATLVHYPIPPHRQGAYRDLAPSLPRLPVAEEQAATVLSLPIGPHLAPDAVDRVVDAVVEAVPTT